MKLTIFGASRGVGLAAVRAAAERGHAVTAVARNAASIDTELADVVAGDVLDPAVVERALAGADAVLVALGTAPSKGDAGAQAQICSRGTRVILDAMPSAALTRIVVVTSYGIGPTRTRRPFPFNVVAATFLKDVMADKERQEDEVRRSTLAWTIAQPLGLTDAPASGTPLISTDGTRGLTQISRADVAAVCLAAIENGSYLRETIAISAQRASAN